MKFWHHILKNLDAGKQMALLYVIDSVGSSPGRQGFKMTVSDDGQLYGSIGGGFMEHKLVELAKSKLKEGPFKPFNKLQIHKADIGENRSGMICSGEQRIAFYYLDELFAFQLRKTIDSFKDDSLTLNQKGIFFGDDAIPNEKFKLIKCSDKKWLFKENLALSDCLYIIGGGHVGLALSELMSKLNFRIFVVDDRTNLNTMHNNFYADKKIVMDYEKLDLYIPEGDNVYLTVMSFGYKTDKAIIEKLYQKKIKYFGVLGSQEKMKQLISELLEEGYEKELIDKIYTPIGLSIQSQTPMEIAVSIAAEIIKIKNKDF